MRVLLPVWGPRIAQQDPIHVPEKPSNLSLFVEHSSTAQLSTLLGLGMLGFNHSLHKVFVLLIKFTVFWCFSCYLSKSRETLREFVFPLK